MWEADDQEDRELEPDERHENLASDAQEEEEEEEPAGEDDADGGSGEEAPQPEDAVKQLRQLKAAHRRSVKNVPAFLEAGFLNFSRDSIERHVLVGIGQWLADAARQAAGRLHTKEMAKAGYDEETVAMALVHRLFEEADVAALFALDR